MIIIRSIRMITAVFFASLTVFSFTNCGGEGGSSDGLDLSRLIPSNFSGGSSQIISLSSNGTNWTWNDPH
ncbi:MAG: hypothetical protein KBH06_07385, partial [Spirochaetes bacterium]|nr:hypothetical protein [Spirochaetota bacterium]